MKIPTVFHVLLMLILVFTKAEAQKGPLLKKECVWKEIAGECGYEFRVQYGDTLRQGHFYFTHKASDFSREIVTDGLYDRNLATGAWHITDHHYAVTRLGYKNFLPLYNTVADDWEYQLQFKQGVLDSVQVIKFRQYHNAEKVQERDVFYARIKDTAYIHNLIVKHPADSVREIRISQDEKGCAHGLSHLKSNRETVFFYWDKGVLQWISEQPGDTTFIDSGYLYSEQITDTSWVFDVYNPGFFTGHRSLILQQRLQEEYDSLIQQFSISGIGLPQSPFKSVKYTFYHNDNVLGIINDMMDSIMLNRQKINEWKTDATLNINKARSRTIDSLSQFIHLFASMLDTTVHYLTPLKIPQFTNFKLYYNQFPQDFCARRYGIAKHELMYESTLNSDSLIVLLLHRLNEVIAYKSDSINRLLYGELGRLVGLDELQAIDAAINLEKNFLTTVSDSGRAGNSFLQHWLQSEYIRRLNEYGEEQELEKKIEQGREILFDIKQMGKLTCEIDSLELIREYIDTLYQVTTFDPYTYSYNLKKRTKKRVYESGMKIFDHYMHEITMCTELRVCDEKVKKLKELTFKMTEMRHKDTSEIEKSLKKALPVNELENRFGLCAY